MFIVEKVTSSDCSLPLASALLSFPGNVFKGPDKVIFDKKDSGIAG